MRARVASVGCLLALVAACAADQDSPGAKVDPVVAAGEPGPSTAPVPKPDAPAPAPEDPGPPAVRYVGRFDTRDAAGPIAAWPGARVIARFSGTEVSVELDERVESWMDGSPSEWDVILDGKLGDKLVTRPGRARYTLAKDLAKGTHEVELYRRSEAQNGVTQILGFDFGGGALLPPPLRKARRVEIVGDSQSTGFGVEGRGYADLDCPGPDHASRWQSFRRAWGARLGESLGAEVHAAAFSGKGMVKNIWRPDREAMPEVFLRANPLDPSSTWDFKAWAPHAVVVMIGGNDFAEGQPDEGGANRAATAAEFTAAYRTFVSMLLGAHPGVKVFLATSPSARDEGGRAARTRIAQTIATVAGEHPGDVVDATPAVAPPTELDGCNGHGNDAFHTRVAAEIGEKVRARLGW